MEKGAGPDIVYSAIPERVAAETSSIVLDLKIQALADSDGGFANADLLVLQGLPPATFSCGYDCELFEENDLKCALPFIKKGVWYGVKATCNTYFFMQNMKANMKGKIMNYDEEIVFCLEGTFRTF